MIDSGVARHAPRNARSCRGSPRGDGCSEDGRGACRDRTPFHNFMIITEFRMLTIRKTGLIFLFPGDTILSKNKGRMHHERSRGAGKA